MYYGDGHQSMSIYIPLISYDENSKYGMDDDTTVVQCFDRTYDIELFGFPIKTGGF